MRGRDKDEGSEIRRAEKRGKKDVEKKIKGTKRSTENKVLPLLLLMKKAFIKLIHDPACLCTCV